MQEEEGMRRSLLISRHSPFNLRHYIRGSPQGKEERRIALLSLRHGLEVSRRGTEVEASGRLDVMQGRDDMTRHLVLLTQDDFASRRRKEILRQNDYTLRQILSFSRHTFWISRQRSEGMRRDLKGMPRVEFLLRRVLEGTRHSLE